ncbi:MAG: sulfotransferase [Chitinophagales bacterium]|nr:sulfotransferase [Chitinophagales bacterium]
MNQQPIIILGMHRSGTTMITKMLENLGLFVGAEKEINHESLFFWEINNWIFDFHTATAEKPHNMRYRNPFCDKVIFESIEYFLQSSKRKKYLGNFSSKYRNIKDIDFPFGWKDPKNTFTVDFWKHIFPNAKIIHIYRNPIDVASSYLERDLIKYNNFKWTWKKKLKRDFLISNNFHRNFRINTIEDGYDLWQEYVDKAISLKHEFPDYLEIKYEDFLANPFEKLKQLAHFSGLEISDEKIKMETRDIKKERAYAFVNNPNYYKIYQDLKGKELMQQLGYDNL